MKFVIVSPKQEWGGAIVLHRLCQCLNEVGYDARILYSEKAYGKNQKKYRFWLKWGYYAIKDLLLSGAFRILRDTTLGNCAIFRKYQYEPVKNCPRKYFPFIGKDTVLVYPDTFYGNIFNAKNVVRWFLYYNRFGKEGYGENDLFYAFRDIFNDEELNPESRKLYLAYFDLNLYKKTNFGTRSGNCYIIRKGKGRIDLPDSFDGPVIDDLPEREKVKVMNACEYCISYDMQTAYTTIAAICGCISVMIPEPGKTWTDYRENNDEHYGEALGFDKGELEYARETAGKAVERYLRLNAAGIPAAEKFAAECKTYFDIKK